MKSLHYTILMGFIAACVAVVAVVDLLKDGKIDNPEAYGTVSLAIVASVGGAFRGEKTGE